MTETEKETMTDTHVVILGDSVFDNSAYVAGGPDVLAHMRALAPDGWRATLCAVDGATTSTFPRQLANVPDDATHLAISLGGNDALQTMPLMEMPTSSIGMGLERLDEPLVAFEEAYRRCVSSALSLGRPVLLLTIYDGDFEPNLRGMTRRGVALFNDVIIRVARELQLPTVEMRHVCNEPGDFEWSVEPSVRGGEKVAAAVLDALAQLGRSPQAPTPRTRTGVATSSSSVSGREARSPDASIATRTDASGSAGRCSRKPCFEDTRGIGREKSGSDVVRQRASRRFNEVKCLDP